MNDDYLPSKSYMGHESGSDGFSSFTLDGQFFFAYSEGGSLRLRSQGYASESSRDNGIASVKKNMGNKEMFKAVKQENGKWVLSLKAANHQEIAVSPEVGSEAEAMALMPGSKGAGVSSFAAAPLMSKSSSGGGGGSDKGDKDDDYLAVKEYEGHSRSAEHPNVAFFKHSNGQFYYAVYNKDGSVRLRSEGFTDMDKRDREFNATMRLLEDAQYYHVFEKYGKYFCVLKDEKGNEVGRSGAQNSKSMALGFIPIVGAAGKIVSVTEKRNVKKSSSKQEFLPCDAYSGHSKHKAHGNISTFKDKDGKLFFTVLSDTGETMFRSSGYRTEAARESGIKTALRVLPKRDSYKVESDGGQHVTVLRDELGNIIGKSCGKTEAAALALIPAAAVVTSKIVGRKEIMHEAGAFKKVQKETVKKVAVKKTPPPPPPRKVAAAAPVAAAAATAAAAPAAGCAFKWWWLLPLLLIPLFFLLRGCWATPPPAAVVAPPPPPPVVKAPVEPKPEPVAPAPITPDEYEAPKTTSGNKELGY